MPLLLTYIDVRTVKIFFPAAAESWLVNSIFPRADRMQGYAQWSIMSLFFFSPQLKYTLS